MCQVPLVLFWKLKFLLLGAGLRKKHACHQQTPYSILRASLLDCAHPFPWHPLAAGRVNFPLSFWNGGVGVQGHPHIHPLQRFKWLHKEKSNKKMPIESSELQQRKTLEINHKNNPYYTTPLDTKFPNLHTNCTLRVLGPYSLAMLYPKQSFSKLLNQSIRNDSQNHSPESPVVSTQNFFASSKYVSNVTQKKRLWKLD